MISKLLWNDDLTMFITLIRLIYMVGLQINQFKICRNFQKFWKENKGKEFIDMEWSQIVDLFEVKNTMKSIKLRVLHLFMD